MILGLKCVDQNFSKAVLIIHGTSDNIVPISYARKAAEVYSSVNLVEIPGAGHRFDGSNLETALNEVTVFVKKCIHDVEK